MANRIYIGGNFEELLSARYDSTGDMSLLASNAEYPLDFPLLDDVVLEAGSEWTSFTEDLGWVGEAVTTMVKINALYGNIGAFSVGVQNVMEAARWKKTNPFRFSVRIPLYTKTDPRTDVYAVYKALMGYTILKKNTNSESYSVPGINLANIANYINSKETDKTQLLLDSGRFVSVDIPGVIYLQRAIIESIRPTISKEVTESGYPLWMLLEVTFVSLFPANTEMLDMVEKRTSPPKSFKPPPTIGK